MIFLLLGLASLLAVMAALGMFSRAQIGDIKQFGVWTLGIGGMLLAALLFLTGRGAIAIAGLVFLAPLIWSWTGLARPNIPAARQGRMTQAEALEVLGLKPGASKPEIKAAYLRLMRAAHPDQGGSDWLAARINQARDVLLR